MRSDREEEGMRRGSFGRALTEMSGNWRVATLAVVGNVVSTLIN